MTIASMTQVENAFAGQPPATKQVFLSWKDVNEYVKAIHKFILSANFQVDAIVTAHKGGLIPSAILAYHLKVNDIYDLKLINQEIIYPKDIMDLNRKNVLVVDNILEKGEKAMYMIKFLQNFNIKDTMFVTLVQKESDEPLISPHFAAKSITKEEWAIFPWEELNY